MVVALERIPEASTGLVNYAERDARVRSIAARLFAQRRYRAGHTYVLDKVMYRRDVLDWKAAVFDPCLKTLRTHVPPDVTRDYVREDIRANTALLFAHRRGPEADIYFLTNVWERRLLTRLAFRVAARRPYFWNPPDGDIRAAGEYESLGAVTRVPVRLGPYGSIFIVFAGPPDPRHVRVSNFDEVTLPDEALAARNGDYYADGRTYRVEGVPAPLQIAGPWDVQIGDVRKHMLHLQSWTEDPATRHFSGTAIYRTRFELPPELAVIYGRGLRQRWEGVRNVYGFEPLPRSGLLGPVVLEAFRVVRLQTGGS